MKLPEEDTYGTVVVVVMYFAGLAVCVIGSAIWAAEAIGIQLPKAPNPVTLFACGGAMYYASTIGLILLCKIKGSKP